MPSVFDRQFKKSGFPGLLAQFGEPVVYWPRSGGQRSINAIIERSPVSLYDTAGNVTMAEFTLQVFNDCTKGILSSELDTGGDQIELLAELGDIAPSKRIVIKKVSESSGVLVLVLR